MWSRVHLDIAGCKSRGLPSHDSLTQLGTVVVQERIAQAKRWLERQPESVIVLYGHSVFWKAFFSHEESMRNCEYRVLHW